MKEYSNVKLEFFIGGTRRDLGNASKKLIDAVLEAKHIPSGMELYPAGCQPIYRDIARYINQCDAHIIVLGARYGEYIEGQKISFTEWEYQQSNGTNGPDAKRPILSFLLNDEEFKEERKKAILEDEREKEKGKDLIRFRNELKSRSLCKFFSNTDAGIAELGRSCVNAIHEMINSGEVTEGVGWIKASSLEASILKDLRGNKFLKRELERLREFSIVGKRVAYDGISKNKQAEVFWDTMIGRVRRNGFMNLFFESGSSLAYVSEKFEELVLRNGGETEPWHIWTNNVLALFQLLLYTNVDVKRFPACAPNPQDSYGAIFPRHWGMLKQDLPKKPRNLFQNEAAAVEEMRAEFNNFGKQTLLLTTSSGWDLRDVSDDFSGPHVGSHPNMLFKRSLFTSGLPVVIFLTAEKLGDPFEIGCCYPVFGPDLPLREALEKYPIALCVGYDSDVTSPTRRGIDIKVRKKRNNPDWIFENLYRLNFDVVYTSRQLPGQGAVISGNEEFNKLLPND
jgi:hypothetical protein